MTTTRGLDCNAWRRPRRKINRTGLLIGFIVGCAMLAVGIVTYSLAHAILAGAGAMECCVPLGDWL